MPKFALTADGVLALVAVVGVGAFAFYLYNKRATIGAALNPLSGTNVASTFVENVITKATGTEDSLGTWLAGWLSPAARKAKADIDAPVVLRGDPIDSGTWY